MTASGYSTLPNKSSYDVIIWWCYDGLLNRMVLSHLEDFNGSCLWLSETRASPCVPLHTNPVCANSFHS